MFKGNLINAKRLKCQAFAVVLLTFFLALSLTPEAVFAQKKKDKKGKNHEADWEAQRQMYINKLNLYWSLGFENYKNKQYQDAAAWFWKVVELDTIKKFPTVFRYLGDSYFKMVKAESVKNVYEKTDSAKSVYEMGLQRYPDDSYLNRMVGYFLAQTEQIDPAIERYETVVKLVEEESKTDPKQFDALKDVLKQLAPLYVKAERRDDAIAAYNRALEIDPNDLEAQNNLAALLAATGDIEAVIAAREKVREQDPKNSQVRFDLGKMYFDQGNYEKAIELFDEYLTLAPNDPGALEYKGISYQRLDRHNESIAEFKKILDIQPQNKKVLAEISRGYKSSGNFTTARTFAARILAIDNAYGLGWIALGEVFEAAADKCVKPKNGKVDYDDKLVYELAYQQYRNAFADLSFKHEAENKAGYLQTVIPTTEDKFMHTTQKRPTAECYKWLPDSDFGSGFWNALNRRLGR